MMKVVALSLFILINFSTTAHADEVAIEDRYIFDVLPDPQIQPDNSKFPDYLTNEKQARERAQDYVQRYINEYLKQWQETVRGNAGFSGVDEITQAYIEDLSTSTRINKIRLLLVDDLKARLDELALKSLTVKPEPPVVTLDEEQYPLRMSDVDQARNRAFAYIDAYVAAISTQWKSIRGSPFDFPGEAVARRAAKWSVMLETDLKRLNSDDPGGIKDRIAVSIRNVDSKGAVTMSRILERRLLTLGSLDSSAQGKGAQVERIKNELNVLEQAVKKKMDLEQYNLKSSLLKDIKELKAEIDGLGTHLVFLTLFLVLAISWWIRNTRLGKKA